MKIEFEKYPTKPSNSTTEITRTVSALGLPQSFQFWKAYAERFEAVHALKSELKRKIKRSEQEAINCAIEIKAAIAAYHKNKNQ